MTIYTKKYEVLMDHENSKYDFRSPTKFILIEILLRLAETQPGLLLELSQQYDLHVVNDEWDMDDIGNSEGYLGIFIPTLRHIFNPSK